MPTEPLDTFDFPRTFAAATFVVDLDDRDADQRYAFLVSGWDDLMLALGRIVFRTAYGPIPTDDQILTHGVAEIMDHIGSPDRWEWATSSDMWPTKCVWKMNVAMRERTITILRLLQDSNERAVFHKNFPGGLWPAKTEVPLKTPAYRKPETTALTLVEDPVAPDPDAPITPAEYLSFARESVSSSYTIVVDDERAYERYAVVAVGWDAMLAEVAKASFGSSETGRYHRKHGKTQQYLKMILNELLNGNRWLETSLTRGDDRFWQGMRWSTETDDDEEDEVGEQKRTIMVFRLHQDATERVLVEHAFPEGTHPIGDGNDPMEDLKVMLAAIGETYNPDIR